MKVPPFPLPPCRTTVWVVPLITVTVCATVLPGSVTVVTVPFCVTVVTVPDCVTVTVLAPPVVVPPAVVLLVPVPPAVVLLVPVPPDALVGQVAAVVTPALVVFPAELLCEVPELEL